MWGVHVSDDEGFEEDRRVDAPSGLFLSRRGAWYHDGTRVRHARLEALLHASIAREPHGGLIVTTGRDSLPFVSEDAPLQVRTLRHTPDDLVLLLSDGREEPVAGRAFFMDAAGRVRCAVRGGAFWALVSRSAGQTLLASLDAQGERILTPGRSCPVREATLVDWTAPCPR